MREIARLGLADRVQIVGRVSDEDLALLYSAADAYVSASVFSHQDAPTMEAMACGAPTVIPTEPDTHEELGPSIVSVPRSTDVEAWLAVLEDVLWNRSHRAYLREAVVQDAAKFSWERTAGETLAVYAELARPGVGQVRGGEQ
jgi:glycosyltransferase involved in cell wall biosynthesis